jgi:hypothetical protein
VEPTNIRFGGGASGTVLHPLVAIALAVAVVLLFVWPRSRLVGPLFAMVFLVPFGQVLVLGGIHLTVYRMVILCGLARLAVTGRASQSGRLAGGFTSIDRIFTIWAVAYCVANSLQWMETQALIKNLGSLLDALGGYFVLRFAIADADDVLHAIQVFAVIAVIMAIFMTNEQMTHDNVFGMLGGIPRDVAVREGRARSCGAFEVYITAGVFGATLLPLFVWLWASGRSKVGACLGMLGGAVIAVTSNASTSLLACAAAIVAFCFWPLRKSMRAVRWVLVVSLVGLHLVMKAPVWALIARVDLTGSSSGFHRYMLVDGCIRHFSDWWLMGVKNYDTWGWDMWDLSNQYVAYALTGGLVTLAAFVLIISRSFGRLGTARKLAAGDAKQEWFLWCLCAALLAHVVAYFGIGYFDQMQFAWYALLAMISVAGAGGKSVDAVSNEDSVVSSYEYAQS